MIELLSSTAHLQAVIFAHRLPTTGQQYIRPM